MNVASMFTKDAGGNLMLNSLGVQQVTSTLYAISPRVSEQKFYTIPFADYMPVMTGNGAFMSKIGHWRTFLKSGGFEEGVQQNAANQSRLEQVDAAFDMVEQKVLTWAKGTSWSVIEIEQAMRANTIFSLIEARQRSLKKEADLGLQRVAFLGIGAETGLLNNGDVYNNTADLTARLPSLSAAQLNTFVGIVYERFRANCSRTADPKVFVMPEADWNGLATYSDPSFPLRTKLEILQTAFQTLTGNAGFKVLKCAYCDKANFDGTNNRYVLHSNDPESLVLNVPLAFTSTAAGTTNGFTFEMASYMQFTGMIAPRPAELYYFSNTAA
jgi:hypothetical protein